ncbi:MAG TPA: hypothetical protein VK213_14290 [Bacteroidales bacterium]|nr:hypothetical protein [Bacteroidales bacterium]
MTAGKSIDSLPSISIKSLLIILIMLPGSGVKAQVLEDAEALALVKETVDNIYNMRFAEATELCDKIDRKYPDHPVVYLLKGMVIYWKYFPLLTRSPQTSEFEELMNTCIDKCENFEPENEAEFLLVNLCARGSLLGFYAGAGQHSKAFSFGGPTYRYLRRSFRFTGSYPDFYFFTGLYNYYREAYPEAHPLYKPVFSLFPSGDMEKGLEELRSAFKGSIFLKAESSTFLSSIYKFFENDYESSSYFSRTIFNDYPTNIVYLLNYAEDKLLTGKYDDAESLLKSPAAKTENTYFKAQMTVMQGILNEKKYNDIEMAEKQFLAGIEQLKDYSIYGKQYMAFAYFGLSRISASRNDKQNERIYRRRANDNTDFPDVNFE